MTMLNEPVIRDSIIDSDRDEVIRLCRLAGNFSSEEIEIAGDLVQERLDKGEASGYYFRFVQGQDRLLGYICYGPIPGTESGWDVYWVVVDQSVQMLGLGTILIQEAESDVAAKGGNMVYVETSSRPDYQVARSFYQAHGYVKAAELLDFYRPGDNKIIFRKAL